MRCGAHSEDAFSEGGVSLAHRNYGLKAIIVDVPKER